MTNQGNEIGSRGFGGSLTCCFPPVQEETYGSGFVGFQNFTRNGSGCLKTIRTWNPNDLYFWRSKPQNKAFSNQNKGHFGSRDIIKCWPFSQWSMCELSSGSYDLHQVHSETFTQRSFCASSACQRRSTCCHCSMFRNRLGHPSIILNQQGHTQFGNLSMLYWRNLQQKSDSLKYYHEFLKREYYSMLIDYVIIYLYIYFMRSMFSEFSYILFVNHQFGLVASCQYHQTSTSPSPFSSPSSCNLSGNICQPEVLSPSLRCIGPLSLAVSFARRPWSKTLGKKWMTDLVTLRGPGGLLLVESSKLDMKLFIARRMDI